MHQFTEIKEKPEKNTEIYMKTRKGKTTEGEREFNYNSENLQWCRLISSGRVSEIN